MFTAKKSFFFERLFAVYNRNLFARKFNALYISGLSDIQQRDLKLPLIIYANHSSWWDGLVAFELSRTTRLDSFVMMEEKQLKRLFLFRYLGAFSVVRENPRSAVESIRYAVDILTEKPARALWIFPQGKILPNEARPFVFFNGLSRIVEKIKNVQVLPVAIRYEFLNDFKPEIFVKIGQIQTIETSGGFTSKTSTIKFAEKLTGLLDRLNVEIARGKLENFEQII